MEAVVEWEKTITPTVRRVGELFSLADGLERRYRAAVECVEKLTPAVLAEAFRGELVQQDPGDEPAEKLLERIGKEREADSAGRLPTGDRVRASPGRRGATRKVVAAVGAVKKRGRRSRAS